MHHPRVIIIYEKFLSSVVYVCLHGYTCDSNGRIFEYKCRDNYDLPCHGSSIMLCPSNILTALSLLQCSYF